MEMRQRRFNLIKSFSLGSLVVIIVAAVLLGWMYRHLAIEKLQVQGERYNVMLMRTMSNAIWPQVKGVMDMLSANKRYSKEDKNYSILVLDGAVKELTEKTNVLKIRIFDNRGRIIYSTQHEQIGMLKDEVGLSSALLKNRNTISLMKYNETIKSIKGNLTGRHILESYQPVINSKTNAIDGIFNIETDITDSYQHMNQSQFRFMSVLTVVLAIVYLALFIVVRHADQVIKRQAKEREGHLHEIESINSDLDEYAKELALARDLALDASKAKSAFLANMSHELRTPLNAIIGYSEMMAEEMEFEGRGSDANDLNKIKTAGAHLLAVINDILDLSKIEAGRMELHLEDVEVSKAVNEVIETAIPLAEKEQNTIKLSISDDVDRMYTDLTRMRQVLLNLLSNACKFTKNGVVTIDVQHKADDNQMIVFTVKDTGMGMKDEQLNNIFEAFKQADLSTTKEFGGTGLGLTISKHFCEMLGGDITVHSEAGIGSTFKVTLPERSSRTTGKEAVSLRKIISPEYARLTKTKNDDSERRSKVSKVLVIDDDLSVSELVMRTLTTEGFDVSVINDARNAVQGIKEWLPDAILLDVMMPEVDGWAILKSIKEDDDLKHTPVIMMTIVDNYAMAESLGADGFVVKPINRKKLKNAITLCLRSNQFKKIPDNVMAN